jgi:hypothetical protein
LDEVDGVASRVKNGSSKPPTRARSGQVLMLNKEAIKHFVVASMTSSIAFLFYFFSLSQGLLVRVRARVCNYPLTHK